MNPVIESTAVMGEPEREQARQLTLSQLRPPRRIPGYEQERFLGRGAFGEVWVAIDSNSGRKVAIKFYHRRGGLDWSLLSREVEKLRYLFGDRHVVQLLQVGWESDPPYYVMEYMESGSLDDLLRTGSLSLEQALIMFRGIATGLAHAHARGILHCDLKPANVMLDQDGQPKLADFGQARLSHEHSPALGTLFYMAPEQADLKAVPDVRWDVYALGAVMYRMLVGEPPYRTQDALASIQTPGTLDERLSRYRHLIAAAPRPTAHRSLPDVDAELAGIIDHCLAANPHDRYPTVQAVFAALDARAANRARRPLLILGGIGPLLVLLVVLVASGLLFQKTVTIAQKEVMTRAAEGNRFAARAAADRLGQEVRTRWAILQHEAQDPEFRKLLSQGKALEDRSNGMSDALNRWLVGQHRLWNAVTPSNIWFADDRHGFQRGIGTIDPRAEGGYRTMIDQLDKFYGWRDYFHGGGGNLLPNQRTPPKDLSKSPRPITRPHRSTVYRRRSTDTWAVAYSVPVPSLNPNDPNPIGVLGMTTDLGTRTYLEGSQERTRFVVMLDTRPDQNGLRGLIVSHPYQEKYSNRLKELPLYYNPTLTGKDATIDSYTDPVKEDGFHRKWLAAVEPVVVPGVDKDIRDTGWLMIVQESRDEAVKPVHDLRGTLLLYGGLAVGLVVIVLTLVWGFVLVVLNAAPNSRVVQFLRRKVGLKSGASVSASGESALSGSGGSGSGTGHTDQTRSRE